MNARKPDVWDREDREETLSFIGVLRHPSISGLRALYRGMLRDSLLRNSFFLLLAQGITLVFGFLFWVLLARRYSASDVGLGASMIAAAGLLLVLCSLGLDTALVRFLPHAPNKSKAINTVLITTALLTMLGALIFVIGTPMWSPELVSLRQSPLVAATFIVGCAAIALFTAIEGVFVSFGASQYLLARNAIAGMLKLLLPFALITYGALGVFGSQAIASGAGVLFLLLMLVMRYRHELFTSVDGPTLRSYVPYGLSLYLSGLAGSLPTLLLPLLVTSTLGAEPNAYYYLAMQVAGLVLMVPLAVTQSLFAEGSKHEARTGHLARTSLRVTSLLLVPAVLFLLLFGKYVLLLFGKSYSTEGFRLLQLLAVSGFFFTFNVVCGTVLRVQLRTRAFAFMTVIGTAIILAFVYGFLHLGIVGVGWGWLVGQALISAIYALFFRRAIFDDHPQLAARRVE